MADILMNGPVTKMRIEILTEDKSGSVVVERMARSICEGAGVDADIKVRPHRGCGSMPKEPDVKPEPFAASLLELLPAKCRAYNNIFSGKEFVLVVVMDSDDKDPDELRSELYECTHRYAPGLRSVIGLCTEEVEAWLLGDRKAVMRAFPECDIPAYNHYIQDSVCGTWETLCRVICPEDYEDIIDIGYPAVGNYKARWADLISEFMVPEDNISPSFRLFMNALKVAAGNPTPVSARAGVRRRTF
ncbi:MAG: hypothetical protein IKE53_00625 [Clostridiales bacterium]|nr:hypothetical protein [Clostridiales bacterium]